MEDLSCILIIKLLYLKISLFYLLSMSVFLNWFMYNAASFPCFKIIIRKYV